MSAITVTADAYALPLLHAAKYPHEQVCGVLLGEVTPQGAIHLKTGIPLFHHWTSLTPMLEVALRQADLYAAGKQLHVVGWYQANADERDSNLHETAIRVANTIRKNAGQAVVFNVNNRRLVNLEDMAQENPIVPYVYENNAWVGVKNPFSGKSSVTLTYDETYAKVRGMISSAKYNQIYDFDDHLDSVEHDWLAYPNSSSK
ncbi:hypothetical protein BCR43DRAFT_459701 [Syncephalastrum racemosum]|uniref:MPN domain-containing protein n=1 Tax=Syncephalastrum racemosum TaxID=13706 RepID=A0A1X2HAX8_SYNRA|nr:hypothetical protein BCR43DRAFT_459701 [Syncephalastrum racemosum]